MEWLLLHQTARVYGQRPSALLGVSPTDPAALLIDVTVSHKAQLWEQEHGLGEYWWLSILKALTGGGDEGKNVERVDMSNVRWL
jgi:hypothetical protein